MTITGLRLMPRGGVGVFFAFGILTSLQLKLFLKESVGFALKVFSKICDGRGYWNYLWLSQ